MDRRQFAIATAAFGGRVLLDPFARFPAVGAAIQNAEALAPAYAESVEMSGLSEDGASEFEVRVARFPPRSSGTLWTTVCVGGQVYNVALDEVRLADPGRTRIEETNARFEVSGASGTSARLERHRDGPLTVSARVAVSAHRSADPPPGVGSEAVTIDARFESAHPPVQVLPARLEVMGRVSATVRTPSGLLTIAGPAKWHEQTGNRPRFAAAFTYLTATGRDHGLLAVARQPAPFGFAWIGRETVKISAVKIAPPADRRPFTVELEDGRRIDGETRTIRTISTPVEGQRRPSATVKVASTIGDMIGHINDWEPLQAPQIPGRG
jgi:hypothetical protein